MINSIEIIDWDGNFPKNYIKNLQGLIPNKIEFKKGLNILIGENGSGKSTILNLIKYYNFCNDKFISKITSSSIHELIGYNFKIDDDKKEDISGIKILGDYKKPIFNLRDSSQLSESNRLENSTSFMQTYKYHNSSTGESQWDSIGRLFQIMFEKYDYDLFKSLKSCNKENLIEYYNSNHIDSNVFTIVMDEPDKNLDLGKVEEIYNIISNPREDTQFIISLHNPALIYKLKDKGNFIELTNGYLDKIIKFIEK